MIIPVTIFKVLSIAYKNEHAKCTEVHCQVCDTYTATGWRWLVLAAQPSTGVACVSAAAVIILTASSHMSVTSNTEPTTWLRPLLHTFTYLITCLFT